MVNGKAVVGLVARGVAVVLAVLVVSSAVFGGLVAGGIVEVGAPAVTEVHTEWGTVNEDRTEIEATVQVDNPNPIGVPNVLGVEYAVAMNDVTVAEGEEEGVGIESGSNDLDFEAEMDNDEVTDWWVSHINNDETTDVGITATVKSPVYSQQFDVKDQQIQTDFLSGLETTNDQPFVVDGERVGTIKRTEAEWGEADDRTTPLTVQVTVRNTASRSITVSDLRYGIRFNDVVLGQGVATESYTIRPGQTRTLEFELELDTDRVQEWWPSHVEADAGTEVEQTRVLTDASIRVESGGLSDRVRLQSMNSETYFKTDIVDGEDEE